MPPICARGAEQEPRIAAVVHAPRNASSQRREKSLRELIAIIQSQKNRSANIADCTDELPRAAPKIRSQHTPSGHQNQSIVATLDVEPADYRCFLWLPRMCRERPPPISQQHRPPGCGEGVSGVTGAPNWMGYRPPAFLHRKAARSRLCPRTPRSQRPGPSPS